MPQIEKPTERPIGQFDRKRATREMSKPLLSPATKDALAHPIKTLMRKWSGGKTMGGKR